MALQPRDQNLFLRKCVSIVHCWAVCTAVLYLEFNPEKCATGWQTFSEVWVGFLWTDLIVSFLTGTASAGYYSISIYFRNIAKKEVLTIFRHFGRELQPMLVHLSCSPGVGVWYLSPYLRTPVSGLMYTIQQFFYCIQIFEADIFSKILYPNFRGWYFFKNIVSKFSGLIYFRKYCI